MKKILFVFITALICTPLFSQSNRHQKKIENSVNESQVAESDLITEHIESSSGIENTYLEPENNNRLAISKKDHPEFDAKSNNTINQLKEETLYVHWNNTIPLESKNYK